MAEIYQIYLISDSTGETLDRIFLALKAQFNNFHYKTNHFSFTRTENQITKILENCKKQKCSCIHKKCSHIYIYIVPEYIYIYMIPARGPQTKLKEIPVYVKFSM